MSTRSRLHRRFWIGLLALLATFVLMSTYVNGENVLSAPLSPLLYAPPSTVTINMYHLFSNGGRTNERCDYQQRFNFGCTRFCTELATFCASGGPYPYPFSTNIITIDIDGTAGAPDAPYNQYLRDVTPLEIDIQSASQHDKPISAVEAQAIAARTYILQRINANYTIDNSNTFQVFVPYFFYSLNKEQQSKVALASLHTRYMTYPGTPYPIEALYGADNAGTTSPSTPPYRKSVLDPISAPYGASIGTSLGGMSSKGASRWAFGHTSSLGPVFSTTPNPPDSAGNGALWSVTFNQPAQVLTHYYTGIELREWSGQNILPALRWLPLQIGWQGSCPPAMMHGQSCTATITVQNSGNEDWICSSSTTYILGYRWRRAGMADVTSSNQLSLCGLAKGDARTGNLVINNLPYWGPGPYLLVLDVARLSSGVPTWSSAAGAWLAYSMTVYAENQSIVRVPIVVNQGAVK